MSKTPQADPPIAPSPAHTGPRDARRVQVRRSGVHGKGLFALRPIPAGERILEYKGELITWAQALRRHPHDPDDPNHTFYFHVDDKHVIDGKVGGNASRWINHACDPNCEAEVSGQRVFIHALRALETGDELFFDYRLVLDGRHTPKVKQEYACRCGSPRCRGTMLGKK
jgi:SET domain-containing protein